MAYIVIRSKRGVTLIMDLLQQIRTALESSSFATYGGPDPALIYFEDEILVGFVCVVRTPEEIIKAWLRRQDEFLRSYSQALRRAEYKSWNAYSVCLSEAKAGPELQSELLKIEEDFRGSRKIARAGVMTQKDVVEALLPLMKIQNAIELRPIDATARVRERLKDLPEELVKTLLSKVSPKQLHQEFVRAE